MTNDRPEAGPIVGGVADESTSAPPGSGFLRTVARREAELAEARARIAELAREPGVPGRAEPWTWPCG